MRMMSRAPMAAALAMLVLTGGGRAAGGTGETVLSSGSARDCAQAALGGRTDNASLQACDNAIDFDSLSRDDRGATLINRGAIRIFRHQWRAALTDLNEGLRLRPEAGEGWANRGGALLGLKRYKEAVDDITKGLALGVKEPAKAYFNRALAYEALDDEKSAYFDYKKAQDLDPTWEAPRHELLRFSVAPPP